MVGSSARDLHPPDLGGLYVSDMLPERATSIALDQPEATSLSRPRWSTLSSALERLNVVLTRRLPSIPAVEQARPMRRGRWETRRICSKEN